TIEIAPEFIEIGRAVLAVGSRPARLLVLVATASTPTGIVEREDRSNALPHGIVCLGGSGQRLAWRSGVPKSSGSDATGRWSVIASPDLLPARRAAQCSAIAAISPSIPTPVAALRATRPILPQPPSREFPASIPQRSILL